MSGLYGARGAGVSPQGPRPDRGPDGSLLRPWPVNATTYVDAVSQLDALDDAIDGHYAMVSRAAVEPQIYIRTASWWSIASVIGLQFQNADYEADYAELSGLSVTID